MCFENKDNDQFDAMRNSIVKRYGDVLSNEYELKYLIQIFSIQRLKPEQEVYLAKRMKKGDKEARERFINANLRLVPSIAKHYIGRGMTFLELIQAGNMGLIKASEKFDCNYGLKFSTYANSTIVNSINDAIREQPNIIYFPRNFSEKIKKMDITENILMQKLRREPSPEELTNEMGLITVGSLFEIQLYSQEMVSLDSNIDENLKNKYSMFSNFDLNMIELVEDEYLSLDRYFAIEDLIYNQMLLELTDREEKILKLRFGLEGYDTHSLVEVGKELNLSRDRILHIESLTLNRLNRLFRGLKKYYY